MNNIFKITLILIISTVSLHAQKPLPVYSLCGKTGNITMTWEEFSNCRKELVADKGLSIGSYVITLTKAEKKDTTYIEFPVKGSVFSKSALESIEKLHKDKKLGKKVLIEAVEILQSGQAARKVPGMTIILN